MIQDKITPGYHLGVKTPKARIRKHPVLVSPAMSLHTLGGLTSLENTKYEVFSSATYKKEDIIIKAFVLFSL